ncbi:MAG: spore maturation protein [Clostridia bacterium]|nr:spore maturation protein [Clostridia bacterium]MBR0028246.1 spore maturation protein [Clostridia bacterium]
MNYIWCGLIIISLITAAVNGNMEVTINAAFDGAKAAVDTILALAGVMCFWTGIMKIAEKSGLSDKIEKLLRPLITFLFPNSSNEAKKFISMNMSANLLGMGNAATPMGIKAMQTLDKENPRPEYASDDMCMLVVLNTTSLQLIPTTIIALRTAANSANPFSVILPIWISSLAAVVAAVTVAKLWQRRRHRK